MIPKLKYTLAVLMTMLLGCTIAVGFVALRGARQGMQFLTTIESSSTELVDRVDPLRSAVDDLSEHVLQVSNIADTLDSQFSEVVQLMERAEAMQDATNSENMRALAGTGFQILDRHLDRLKLLADALSKSNEVHENLPDFHVASLDDLGHSPNPEREITSLMREHQAMVAQSIDALVASANADTYVVIGLEGTCRGKGIYSNQENLFGADLNNSSLFREVLQENRITKGIDRIGSDLVIGAATVLKDSKGTQIAVLICGSKLDLAFLRFLTRDLHAQLALFESHTKPLSYKCRYSTFVDKQGATSPFDLPDGLKEKFDACQQALSNESTLARALGGQAVRNELVEFESLEVGGTKYSTSFQPLISNEGAILGLLAVGRDIQALSDQRQQVSAQSAMARAQVASMRVQRQEVESASQLQSQRLSEVNKASRTAEACLREFVAQAGRDAQFSRALVWAALAVAGVVFAIILTFADKRVLTPLANAIDAIMESKLAIESQAIELEQANGDIHQLLDSAGQGFLKLDCYGRIGNRHSRAVIDMLGEIPVSRRFVELLGRHDQDVADWFELGWDDVFAGIMPIELTLDQLPKKIQSEAICMSLQYVPLFESGELTHIVVVVSDITANVEREKLEAENREFMAIIDRITSDQVAFLEFLAEAESLVEKLRQRNDTVTDELLRDIHTLKGNTSMFGLSRVSKACHAIEDYISENNELPATQLWTELFQAWASTRGKLRRLISDTEIKVTLGDDEYSSILLAILNNSPKSQLATQVAGWRLEATRRRLDIIAEQIVSLGARLGKGVLTVEIDDNGLRTDPRYWTKFWSALIHVVRNCVDHGIETPDERIKQNKSETGTIRLATSIEDNRYVVSIRDNGRGIQWERIREIAKRNGLPCELDSDLAEALFHVGVSTSQAVSETSGRGVGMAAVRERVQKLNGKIEVHSRQGEGTEFRFLFPIESMANEMRSLLTKYGIENLNAITCNHASI